MNNPGPPGTIRPACYGVMCPHHKECLRYTAAEGRIVKGTIYTCADEKGRRPMLVTRTEEVAWSGS